MTDSARRLSAERRQEIQRQLDNNYPSGVHARVKLVDLRNALHDLDVADAEIANLKQVVDMDRAFDHYIGSELGKLPCCHEQGAHKDTPPMMWPELIGCILKKATEDANQKIAQLCAQLKSAALEIAERSREVAELQDTIADWKESARIAAGESCKDGKHCTCVPLLRKEMKDLCVVHGAILAELTVAQIIITQQGAAIAAMREAVEQASDCLDDQGYFCPFCEEAGKGSFDTPVIHLSNCPTKDGVVAQLAADHDAAVRVDERRKVLEEAARVAIGYQISETSLCAEWGRQCAAAIRRLATPPESEADR